MAAGAGEALGEFFGGEVAVRAFPFGDALAAGVEGEPVGGGFGDPGADGGPFGFCGCVDGVGEFGWE